MNINSRLKRVSVFVAVGLLFATTSLVYAAVTVNLFPSSEGKYMGWTPSAGTIHYTMVDEAVCNGLTDFNYTNNNSARDSYGVSLSSVPNGATITAISVTPCASRNLTGFGSSAMRVFYRYSGSSPVDGTNYTLASTTAPTVLTSTIFNGLSLIKTPTSTLEIGAQLVSGDRGARLSQIFANITFTTSTTSSPQLPPTVTTTSAVASTTTSTVLWGAANPNGAVTVGWFRYATVSPGTCNDTFGIRTPVSGGTPLGSGNSSIPYSAYINNLTPNTTYYFCAIASNSGGTGFGLIKSFTTLP